MSVPIAAVDLLSENLNNLLSYDDDMVAAMKENISRLRTELTSIRQLMVELSRYDSNSETLKLAVKEIRQILDESEDAVDTYVLQSSIQRSRSLISRIYHNIRGTPILFRDLEKQIGYMAGRVKQINEDTLRRGLEVLQYQEISELSRAGDSTKIEALMVEEEHVIGFDQAAEDVANLLVTGCANLEVISIAGMSGLGKTTLISRVLKHPLVESMYTIHASVYVSREYDKKDVLHQILASITGRRVKNMSEDELENGVSEELKDKQYLVVLDDIWEAEDWNTLCGAFPNNQIRCRVLITTTNERVAEYANPKNPDSLYRLDFLDPEHSRRLLRWRVFNTGDLPRNLEEYEKKIIQKCDGLPLALVLVAGILSKHPSRPDWWKAVASSVQDYVARASEGNKLIEIMYGHLPHHLKPCFLYLGVFREDSEISVWKLVRLWVAEGFIEQGGERNWEDTAEKYLEELVQRNMVMVVGRKSNRKLKSCRMHNSLIEYCKAKAMEENLFQKINKDLSLSGNRSLDQCRRLCIDHANLMNDYIGGDASGKRVRSFITFGKQDVDANSFSIIPKKFKLLRVLETQSLLFSSFPSDISGLICLKYLAISTDFTTIPASLSCLWNLQTLIIVVVTECPNLDIKADLWKMPQFRHLHTNASATLPSPGTKRQKAKEEGVSTIQTLCTIAPESCLKRVFDLTPKLKKLGIRGMFAKVNGGSDLFQHLSSLESLENLKLLSQDENLTPRLQIKDLPRNLTKITLLKTRLKWEEMSELGKLEKLEVLMLKDFSFQGAEWNAQDDGFPSLIHLYIGKTDLKMWEVSALHFPKLECLELEDTDELRNFPAGLEHASCLQDVALYNIHPDVASSARKLQQTIEGYKSSSFRLTVLHPDH